MQNSTATHDASPALWIVALIYGVGFGGLIVWVFWKGRIMRFIRRGPVDDKAAVQMPRNYLTAQNRKLVDLREGETAYIGFTDLAVDRKGATFVNQNAKVYEEPNVSRVKVRIERRGYTVLLPKTAGVPWTFTPQRLHSFISYMPVVQIYDEGGENWGDPPPDEGDDCSGRSGAS